MPKFFAIVIFLLLRGKDEHSLKDRRYTILKISYIIRTLENTEEQLKKE
jgi:hypothetical protein